MLYIKVFIATAWDIYFLSKSDYYKSMSIQDVVEDISNNLGFLFDQQHAVMPDISEMVRGLFQIHLPSNDLFFDCDEKKRCINKYFSQFSTT